MTGIFSLHQKGTSLSNETVAPSQYDLSCWWDILTQTQQQHQKGLYIHPFTGIFLDSLLLFTVFFCSFLKRKVVLSASDLSTYWY